MLLSTLALLVFHWCSLASTLPTLPAPVAIVTTPTTVTDQLDAGNTTALPANLPISIDANNYITEEREFENFLEQLKREQEEKATSNRANYVADDVSIEEIMRLIENATGEPEVVVTDGPEFQLATELSYLIVSTTTTATTTTPSTTTTTPTPMTTTTTTTTTLRPTTTTQSERDLECPICLSSMRDTEVEVLSCNHEFHANCFRKWIEHDRKLALCPICRREVTNSRQITHDRINE